MGLLHVPEPDAACRWADAVVRSCRPAIFARAWTRAARDQCPVHATASPSGGSGGNLVPIGAASRILSELEAGANNATAQAPMSPVENWPACQTPGRDEAYSIFSPLARFGQSRFVTALVPKLSCQRAHPSPNPNLGASTRRCQWLTLTSTQEKQIARSPPLGHPQPGVSAPGFLDNARLGMWAQSAKAANSNRPASAAGSRQSITPSDITRCRGSWKTLRHHAVSFRIVGCRPFPTSGKTEIENNPRAARHRDSEPISTVPDAADRLERTTVRLNRRFVSCDCRHLAPASCRPAKLSPRQGHRRQSRFHRPSPGTIQRPAKPPRPVTVNSGGCIAENYPSTSHTDCPYQRTTPSSVTGRALRRPDVRHPYRRGRGLRIGRDALGSCPLKPRVMAHGP